MPRSGNSFHDSVSFYTLTSDESSVYEVDIIERFSKVPVFTLSDVSQVITNRDYAKKFMSGMLNKNKVNRIRKNLYTFHDDPFLVATYILKPSYISSVSSLSYHHLITQIPKEIFCFTPKQTRKYFFRESIRFHHTKYFFGFEMENYLGHIIAIATPEKAAIDSIGKVPLSVIEEAFGDMDPEKMIRYLHKIKKSSIIKRIGYMLEAYGYDAFPELNRYINDKYIPLDPIAKHSGTKNRKWRLIT